MNRHRRPGRTARRRRMRRRSTRGGAPEAGAGRGGSRHVPGDDGGRLAWRGATAADRWGGGRQRRRVGGRRIPGGRQRWSIPGLEDGGIAEGGGRGGWRRQRRRRRWLTQRRRWWRIGDKKVSKCWRGRVAAFIYRPPFSLESCNEPWQRGPFVTVG
jgi:hypothetical protein